VSRLVRRLGTVGAALAVLAVPALPARADGGDTAAVAINTKDGFDLFKLAFQIRRATGDVVDPTNAAFAYASCTDCQTVALAIQIVLISGTDSSTVAPENIAIAINESCTLCDTLASAYQFVITADGRLNFTAEGHQRLAKLRQALLDLKKADLTGPEIQAQLDALMTELASILSTDLVVAGNSGGAATPSATPAPTAHPPLETPSATPSETVAPTDSATPSESATADTSATAEPTATATP
jgi:putative peptide zinc metalloprotease protein